MTRQTTKPNSSPATAKTKSACASGSAFLTRPSPGPRPSSPPLPKASIALVIWKVSPEDGSRKRSTRLRTCGSTK